MKFYKALTSAAIGVVCISAALAESVAPAEETAVVNNDEAIYEFFYNIEDLLTTGKTNEATVAFEAGLVDEKIGKANPRLFLNYISYLCFIGESSKAEEKFLSLIRTNEELGGQGFEIIYSSYLYANEQEKALKWATILLEQPISVELRQVAFNWVVDMQRSAGNFEEISNILDKYSTVFSTEVIARNVFATIMSFEKQSDLPLIDKFAAVFSKLDQDSNWVNGGKVFAELHKQYINGDWDIVNALLPEVLKFVDDSIVQQEINKIVKKTKATGKLDKTEMLLFTIVMELSPDTYPRTRMYAAREWAGIPILKNDITWYPARLSKLKDLGYSPRELYRIFSSYFFDIVNDAKVLAEVCKFGEELFPKLATDDEGLANLLRMNLLDGYFLTKNYDKVIAMLEQGIPERDEAWIKMTIAKTKADRAYEAKNFDEAIKQYSLFVELLLAGEDEAMPDPTSDIVYTKDSVAGKNYKRIADIQKEAGKPAEEIAASIAKAKEAFTKAKESNTYGKATADYLEQSLEELK